MPIKGIAFLMVFGTCLLCDLEAAGNDGQIQYPNSGEYCANYHEDATYRFDLPIPCYADDCGGGCDACKGGSYPECPWECGSFECRARYVSFNFDSISYDYVCAAGCVSTAICTPIANAAFTGPGTEVGNANSCTFECNAGFVQSGLACVCPAGQYHADDKCNACQTCSNGEWLQNCAGSDAGACAPCEN
jgi:hypothetical protein